MKSKLKRPHEAFTARGGWWVLAQVPVMLGAFGIPLIWGTASFDAANFVQLAGGAVTTLGLLFSVTGLTALGRALTPFPRPLENSLLLQSGIYAWVRHPIYSGLIVTSFGWSIAWQSMPGLIFAGLVFAFFDRKSAFEEHLLRAQFPEYTNYSARVRKLIPWIY
jgi:protein-S-isoprenylcysteine O-methyltransferase Ste14